MLKLNCELNVYLINIAGLVLFPIVLRIFKVIGPKELNGVKHLFTSIQKNKIENLISDFKGNENG